MRYRIRTTAENTEKIAHLIPSGTKHGTTDPHLRAVIGAWPTLPVTVKEYQQALVAMPAEKIHSLGGMLADFAPDRGDIFENA